MLAGGDDERRSLPAFEFGFRQWGRCERRAAEAGHQVHPGHDRFGRFGAGRDEQLQQPAGPLVRGIEEPGRGSSQKDRVGLQRRDAPGRVEHAARDPVRSARERDGRAQRVADDDRVARIDHVEYPREDAAVPGPQRRSRPLAAGEAGLPGRVEHDRGPASAESTRDGEAGGGVEVRAGHEDHFGAALADERQMGARTADRHGLAAMRLGPGVEASTAPVGDDPPAGLRFVQAPHGAPIRTQKQLRRPDFPAHRFPP